MVLVQAVYFLFSQISLSKKNEWLLIFAFVLKKKWVTMKKINLCGEFSLILNYLNILTKHGKKEKKSSFGKYFS